MRPLRAAHGDLTERRVVPIALAHLAKEVGVILTRHGRAGCDDVAVINEELTDDPGVEAPGVERFDVRLTSSGK